MDTESYRLSILIPTYNDICVELVDALRRQANSLPNLTFEVLVADDGSTQPDIIEANRAIDSLAHCKYLRRERNEGRSSSGAGWKSRRGRRPALTREPWSGRH